MPPHTPVLLAGGKRPFEAWAGHGAAGAHGLGPLGLLDCRAGGPDREEQIRGPYRDTRRGHAIRGSSASVSLRGCGHGYTVRHE